MRIIKKDGTYEEFNGQKIVNAVTKSAARVMVTITDEQFKNIVGSVIEKIHEKGLEDVPIYEMHNIVESVLDKFNPDVAKSYRDYRNYKKDFVHMMNEVYMRSQSIRFIGDKENSNADSTLVATKRCLIFNELNKRLYQKFFMTKDELQAIRDGYIYVHDQSARLDTMNCFERMTKFITKDGIKSFYDFEDGDKVVVMSHKGIWRNAVVRQYGEQSVQEILFTSQGIRRAILATKNHRWILKNGTETTSIKVGDELCIVPEEKYAKRNWTVKEIIPLNDRNKVPVWCLEVEEDHSFLLEAGIPTGNCCLSDIGSIMKDGFEMGNIWYNEPKTLDVAFDVIGDIILATAAQQYGGYTVPEIDKILAPYAKKSYDKYMRELEALAPDASPELQERRVMNKLKRDFEQGFQGIEMKLNTVGSSRGDYPFITMTFGLATDKFGKMASKTFLEVHMKGQGKEGFKKPVLFPKLVFLYDENLHGPGCVNEDVFEAGIQCSAKTMYPDWLSLSGEGYVAEMYQKYGKVISPMGCVDGKELVTYKVNGKLFVETFEEMWNRISWLVPDRGQTYEQDTNRIISLFNEDIEIYDTLKGFVKVKYLIRNMQSEWYDITLSGGRILNVTNDHPFETSRGVVLAKDLKREDEIYIGQYQYSEENTSVGTLDAKINGYMSGMEEKIPSAVFLLNRNDRYHFLAGIIKAKGEISPIDSRLVEIECENRSFATKCNALALSLFGKYRIPTVSNCGVYKYLISENETHYIVQLEMDSALEKALNSNEELDIPLKTNDSSETYSKAIVVNKTPESKMKYSYDVTTESEHFEVSGVYSHNCRAFLSPWYERGGMEPADENDVPVFVGRFNVGAVSLHLPMILAKARRESRGFYEVLDYYLEMIRGIHKRTYDYLGEMKASVNPVMFCEGGFYGGHLKLTDKIKPILKPMTASFGITALNELQELYNGKSIREDGEFALEVMRHINDKLAQFKKEDGWLYAVYGTPAERLCSLQIDQFRQQFGIIDKVSDRPYVSNSFHCHVTEDMSPIEKQDCEERFWNLFNGGKIQYVRYPVSYNVDAVRTLVRRAMKKGFYEGVNLSLAYCDDCGHQELEMDVCPVCGSRNLTKIDRMNGYLSYSRIHGDTRLNAGKMAEIAERKSM